MLARCGLLEQLEIMSAWTWRELSGWLTLHLPVAWFISKFRLPQKRENWPISFKN